MKVWRLLGTSVRVSPDSKAAVWQNAVEYAMLERLGRDNALAVAQAVGMDRRRYAAFPIGDHGENYFGCPKDATLMPGWDEYVKLMLAATEKYYARRVYKIDVTRDGWEKELKRNRTASRDVRERARKTMTQATDDVADIWRKRCQDVRRRYGDVYAEVVGTGVA